MIFLDHFAAKRLLAGEKRVSLDLGLTQSDAPDVPRDWLETVAADEECAYFIDEGHLFKAMMRDGNVYKLVPTREGHAPMLTISGIRMHLVKDTNPEENARAIVSAAGILPHHNVLDTCTGLGYTAIAAMERGARVTTIELDENVVEMARLNPWSKKLFEGGAELVQGDVAEVVKQFSDGSFDAVIHDPPRLVLAGELYSLSFYKELLRVARPRAKLVHYTGAPGARQRGKSIVAGVIKRLREAGWSGVAPNSVLQGVTAFKAGRQRRR
jgi:hypothetical protein